MDAPSTALRTDEGRGGACELHAPVASPVRVSERPREARPPEMEAKIEARWSTLRAVNPRLFDGQIWSVRGFDGAAGGVECVRDRYAALAVQPEVHTGACLLAVTGIVWRSRGGEREVLLARRGPGVFAYPGLWEFAPAGGVECDGDGPPGEDALRGQLCREGREEFDMPEGEEPFTVGRAAAMVHDHRAFSLDVVFWCEAGEALERRLRSPLKGWECDGARWVTHAEAAAWVEGDPDSIIPPTRMLLRQVAWSEAARAGRP